LLSSRGLWLLWSISRLKFPVSARFRLVSVAPAPDVEVQERKRERDFPCVFNPSDRQGRAPGRAPACGAQVQRGFVRRCRRRGLQSVVVDLIERSVVDGRGRPEVP
jgi:hypothetical protein